MSFIFHQTSPTLITNIGVGTGGSLAQQIPHSFSVEFDIHRNGNYNDPLFDHIDFMKDGNMRHVSTDDCVPIRKCCDKIIPG